MARELDLTSREETRRLEEELARLGDDDVRRKAEIIKLLKVIRSETETSIDRQEERFAQIKAELELIQSISDGIESQYIINDKNLELAKEDLKLQSVRLQNYYEEAKLAGILTDEMHNLYLEQQKYISDQADSISLQEKSLGFGRRMAKNLGVERAENTTIGLFLKDTGKFMEKATEGFLDMMTPLNLLSSTLEKVIESNLAFISNMEKAGVAADKSSGQIDFFNLGLQYASQSLITAGVSTEEATSSFNNLSDSYTNFLSLNAMQQANIIETISLLEHMGLSSQFTSKNIADMTRTFGMSGVEAAKFQTRFSRLSNRLEMDIGLIEQGFASASESLYAFSSDSNVVSDSFAKLAKMSKETNISIQNIIKITDKFDKFDTAADSVGRLNTLLGGPFLSTLDMIQTTDPAERFKKIADAIQETGLSFDQMTYYQKKMYTESLGLESIADLAGLMNGNFEDLGDSMANMSQKELLELKQNAAAFNTVMDNMYAIFQNTVILLSPLVSIFNAFLSVLVLLGPVIGFLINTVMAFNLVSRGLKLWQFFFDSLPFGITNLNSMTASLQHLSAAMMANKTATFGTIIGAAIGGFLLGYYLGEYAKAVGTVAAAIGMLTLIVYGLSGAEKTSLFLTGIGLLVAGLSMLATGIFEGFSPSILLALGALAGAFYAVGAATNSSIPGLLSIALVISTVAIAAFAIGYAIGNVGKAFKAAGMAVMMAGKGFSMVSKSISEISILKALAVAKAFRDIADAISSIPLLKSISLTKLVNTINNSDESQMDQKVSGVRTLSQSITASGVTPSISTQSLGQASIDASVAAGSMVKETKTSQIEKTTQTTQELQFAKDQVSKSSEIVFNLNLNIDGEQFKTIVNKVEVNPTKNRALYDSIRNMLGQG